MKWGWVAAIAGLYFFSQSAPQPTSSSPGGMVPVEPIGDTIGSAINSATGQTIMVADPLPVTVQSSINNATSFAIDPSDESFAAAPPIDSNLTLIVPTQPQPTAPAPMVAPLQLAPGISVPGDSNNGIVPVISSSPANMAPGGVGSMTASPSPFLTQQIPGGTDVPTGNTTSQWSADGSALIYYMQYRRPDGNTYNVPFDPFSGIIQAPQQVATTPLGAAANANPPTNPVTGRVGIDNV